MPLTDYQAELACLLSVNRTSDSHLAGGAALHFEPNSARYSNDLDYFHDSVERVASAFAQDETLLTGNGYTVSTEIHQPGFIRAQVGQDQHATKVDWAHDSAWRFMPTNYDDRCGYMLHPVDLAVNKVLALAGRDEARDFLDVLFINKTILKLGPLCWAAVGKDPGFTPLSLLELLRRRGKYQPRDFSRLMLTEEISLPTLKMEWLELLKQAEAFIDSRPHSEYGCLYYAPKENRFVSPLKAGSEIAQEMILHYGRPGGVLPKIVINEIS